MLDFFQVVKWDVAYCNYCHTTDGNQELTVLADAADYALCSGVNALGYTDKVSLSILGTWWQALQVAMVVLNGGYEYEHIHVLVPYGSRILLIAVTIDYNVLIILKAEVLDLSESAADKKEVLHEGLLLIEYGAAANEFHCPYRVVNMITALLSLLHERGCFLVQGTGGIPVLCVRNVLYGLY